MSADYGDDSQHPFTVILLYPDYATDDFGSTCIRTAYAKDATEALAKVRAEFMRAVEGAKDPDDFRLVAVFAGDLTPLC
jgi:hypothetical protein